MFVRDVTGLLVELGLVSAAAVARVEPALDEPLDHFGAPAGVAVAELMVELGAGVAVHTDDVDDVTEAYPSTLQDIAACTGGLFTVTDVTVTPPFELSARAVRFRSNGTPVEWIVDDHGPDYLDTLVFFERIDDFTDSTDPRRWADVEVDGEPLPDRYLFGNPRALRLLAERFGFTVDIRGLPAD